MLCPVCNALSLLDVLCPKCGSSAEDEGRWSDWSGPYSPYESASFDSSDIASASEEYCLHAVRCIRCQIAFTAEIAAWHC
ncbi:hypothetical protein [Cohnella soli]|uniref:Uncharacterized protein n=1 Tax=Cohnella soli TaxID=425005 RepID=A0ABW0HXB0_9BACL